LTETTQFLHDLLHMPAILVTVQQSRGSVPREVGAWMAVFAHTTVATVGGGRLEWDAIQYARTLLVQSVPPRYAELQLFRLGPRLGQCCGGEVQLCFESVTALDVPDLQARLSPPRTPVALFGGGHVGSALVQVLARLPLQVRWIDSREAIFPTELPYNVECEHNEPVQAAMPHVVAGSLVVIMSFSHAEDLEVVAACLQRQRERADLPFVGLIGSKTKWASFQSRLQMRGFTAQDLEHITCPIGIAGIADKRPSVIAVAIAAQLLQHTSDTKRS
jgi:xanthine dehydrogenase accessory factor